MKIHHKPQHWILVALILAALLLTLSDAHGQSTGAGAVFEGRPAMSGAQGGQGALAGPPQGGIGTQGAAGRADSLAAREDAKPAPDPGVNPTRDQGVSPSRDEGMARPARDPGIKPARDQGIAKDQRSTVDKTKRAAKRVIKRSRTGVGDFDAARDTAGAR